MRHKATTLVVILLAMTAAPAVEVLNGCSPRQALAALRGWLPADHGPLEYVGLDRGPGCEQHNYTAWPFYVFRGHDAAGQAVEYVMDPVQCRVCEVWHPGLDFEYLRAPEQPPERLLTMAEAKQRAAAELRQYGIDYTFPLEPGDWDAPREPANRYLLSFDHHLPIGDSRIWDPRLSGTGDIDAVTGAWIWLECYRIEGPLPTPVLSEAQALASAAQALRWLGFVSMALEAPTGLRYGDTGIHTHPFVPAYWVSAIGDKVDDEGDRHRLRQPVAINALNGEVFFVYQHPDPYTYSDEPAVLPVDLRGLPDTPRPWRYTVSGSSQHQFYPSPRRIDHRLYLPLGFAWLLGVRVARYGDVLRLAGGDLVTLVARDYFEDEVALWLPADQIVLAAKGNMMVNEAERTVSFKPSYVLGSDALAME